MAVVSTAQLFGGDNAAAPPTPPAGDMTGAAVTYDAGDGVGPIDGTVIGRGTNGFYVRAPGHSDKNFVGDALISKLTPSVPPDTPAAEEPTPVGPNGGKVVSTADLFSGKSAEKAAPAPGPDGFLANVTAPINRSIASVIGGANQITNAIQAPANWLTGKLGGSPVPDLPNADAVMAKMPDYGINDPNSVQQNGAAGRIGKAAGETTDLVAKMLATGGIAAPEIAATKLALQSAPNAGSALNTLRTIAPDLLAMTPEATGGSVVAPLVSAATQGIGGGMASELVPDRLKPTADLAGQVVAGGIPTIAGAFGRSAAKIGTDAASRLLQPFRSDGAERAATTSFAGKLGDAGRAGTIDAIENEPRQLVEGSDPTTAALTQSPGLAQLQLGRQDLNGPAYIGRKDAQADAQLGAIADAAPAEANPEAFTGSLEQQLADRQAKGASAVKMAQEVGDEAVNTARDAQTDRLANVADAHGYQSDEAADQNALAERLAQTTADARTGAAAQTRDEAIAATGASDASRGELGAQQRSVLKAERSAQAGPAGKKFQAVDPEGNLALEIPAAREQVQKLVADMGEADALSPEEERLYGLIQRTPVKKYKDVQSIDAALGNAIRAARSNPLEANAARRMGDVLSALREDVHSATGLSSGEIEAEMAARGAPPHPAPKDMDAVTPPAAERAAGTAVETAGQRTPEGQNSAVVNIGSENARSLEGSGRPSGAGPHAVDTGESASLGNGAGEGRAGTRGSDGAAEGQGASGGGAQENGASGQEALAPHFPPEALDRWLDAKAAWRSMKQTFDNLQNAVGKVLAKGPGGAEYRLTDSQIMDAFWRGSGARPEDIRALVKAVGGDPDKLSATFNYIANDMRRSVVKPGTNEINPTAYARWVEKHGSALNVLDALSGSPQLRQRLENAVSAQHALNDTRESGDALVNATKEAGKAQMKALAGRQKDELSAVTKQEAQKVRDTEKNVRTNERDMTAEHQAAMSDWQKSYAGQFLNDRDPQQAIQKILKSGTGNPVKLTEALTELGQRTAFDKDARAGLQKLITDELSKSLVDANGWVKPDTFRRFVSDNQVGLRKVFSPDQLRNLDAVAADLERNDSVNHLAKLNVGPTTGARMGAQKAAGEHGHGNSSVIGYLLGERLGDLLGHKLGVVGELLGNVAGIVGQKVAGSKLDAFNRAKGDVLDKMLLDPDFAKAMLMKYRPEAESMIAKRLGQGLKRVGLIAGISTAQQAAH